MPAGRHDAHVGWAVASVMENPARRGRSWFHTAGWTSNTKLHDVPVQDVSVHTARQQCVFHPETHIARAFLVRDHLD